MSNLNQNFSTDKTFTPRHQDTLLHTDWLFLHAQLPPEKWYDSEFSYKTGAWLHFHTNFRRRQNLLEQTGETYLDIKSPLSEDNLPQWQNYRSNMLRLLYDQISHLHGHHGVEDSQYFPYFVQHFPRLKPGFAVLDSDHHSIHAMLDELESQCHQLYNMTTCQPDFADKLHDKIKKAGVLLNRHLSDEEDLVIPILGIL